MFIDRILIYDPKNIEIQWKLPDEVIKFIEGYLYNKSHGYIWTPDTLEIICSGNEYDPEKIGKQMLEMKVKLQKIVGSDV